MGRVELLKNILLGLAASVLLASCGFQLRGAPNLPEGTTIFVRAPSAIARELEIYLRDGGATITAQRDEADAVLDVSGEDFYKRVLSVDPDTGKEREFELSYTVSFYLRESDGSMLVERQTLKLLRDYVFDADQVIGKSREQGVLRKEMRRDAAQQILSRINAALE